MTTKPDAFQQMTRLVQAQPTNTLCDALLLLHKSPNLTEDDKATRAVLIITLCTRYPAVDEALQRWAESPSVDDAIPLIVKAARSAACRPASMVTVD